MDFWQEDAVCAASDNPDLWFSDDPQIQALVINVCQSCPVRNQCLEAALAVPAPDDWGIWGGLTRDKRRRLRAAEAAA